jgi:hypothetical protein
MSQLGHLDQIDAFEFSRYLCLLGRGTRPTLGWASWFAPIHVMPNTYQFLQEPPTGSAIRTVIPLQVVGVFISTGVKEVVVRHSMKNKPTDLRVAVRPVSPADERAISGFMPPMLLTYLHGRGADRTPPLVGTSFTLQLGSVDIPFACGTWNDLPRARRYEVHLDVEALLPGAADIEEAVQACFGEFEVADALAALLTPNGWDGGLPAFRRQVEASLQARLGDKLVNAQVRVTSRCVGSELHAFPDSPVGIDRPTPL